MTYTPDQIRAMSDVELDTAISSLMEPIPDIGLIVNTIGIGASPKGNWTWYEYHQKYYCEPVNWQSWERCGKLFEELPAASRMQCAGASNVKRAICEKWLIENGGK